MQWYDKAASLQNPNGHAVAMLGEMKRQDYEKSKQDKDFSKQEKDLKEACRLFKRAAEPDLNVQHAKDWLETGLCG
jgi:TPR repeat protein